jgi:hypothetical protein
MWDNLASACQGDPIFSKSSGQTRDLLAKQMTPQQIAEAQKLARECQQRDFRNCD